jgi:hypothetical protein
VPSPEHAVVGIWGPDAFSSILVTLGRGERLVIGRRDDGVPDQAMRPGVRLITLPVGPHPYMSRRHLLVARGHGGWRLGVLPDVRNPGRMRHWGDLHWRKLGTGDQVEPRNGLASVLLPGEPHYRVTLTAAEHRRNLTGRSGHQAGGVATEREDTPPHGALIISPAQLDALVSVLADAVSWPPEHRNGRVRKWSELSGGEGKRRAYDRLAAAASADPSIAWIDNQYRGVDPELLRELVSAGYVDYHLVYRKFNSSTTVSLIPTHHTHDMDGQRKAQ